MTHEPTDHGGTHPGDAARPPVPGWYPSEQPGTDRWWDGTGWSGYTRPTPSGTGPNWRILGPVIGGVVAAVVALVVVLTLVLGGGSGASSAPRDATEADFCEAVDEMYGLIFVLAFADGDTPWETGRIVEVLTETGTPADVTAEERAGFEQLVEGMERADGMTRSELEELEEGEESPETEAFQAYSDDTCGAFME